MLLGFVGGNHFLGLFGGTALQNQIIGLVDGVAEIGFEGNISYSLLQADPAPTIKWSLSASDADPADFGSGENPNSLAAGAGQTAYLHIIGATETDTFQFEIRWPHPVVTTLSAIYDEDTGNQVLDLAAGVQFGGNVSYSIQQSLSSVSLAGSDLTIATDDPLNGIVIVRVADQDDPTRFADLQIDVAIIANTPEITNLALVSKTATEITLSFDSDVDGAVYFVNDESEIEPASEEVRDGLSDLGQSLATGSQAIVTGANQITISGLPELTQTWTHVAIANGDGDLSLVASIAVTTNASAGSAPQVGGASVQANGSGGMLIRLMDLLDPAPDSKIVAVPVADADPAQAQVIAGDRADDTDAPIAATATFVPGQPTASIALPEGLNAEFKVFAVLRNGTDGPVLSLGTVLINTQTAQINPVVVDHKSFITDTPQVGDTYAHVASGVLFGPPRPNRAISVIGTTYRANDTFAGSQINGQPVALLTDRGSNPDFFAFTANVPDGETGDIRLDYGNDYGRGAAYIVIAHDSDMVITELFETTGSQVAADMSGNVTDGAFLYGVACSQTGAGGIGSSPVLEWTAGLSPLADPAEFDLWQPGGGNPILFTFGAAENVPGGARTITYEIDGTPLNTGGLLVQFARS